MLVGIYYTEVEDWFFEWYNGGLRWEGYIALTSFLIIETYVIEVITKVYYFIQHTNKHIL